MANEMELRAKLVEKLGDVLVYRGNAAYVEFIGLLQAIEDSYMEDLMSVKKDSLEFKQGAARQVRLLRLILTNTKVDAIGDLPKV